MAQRTAVVDVEGHVVKHERKHGSMPGRENPNETITWDYIEARLLTATYDTVDVRFPSDGSIPVPGPGELVRLRCNARVSMGNLRMDVVTVEAALVDA